MESSEQHQENPRTLPGLDCKTGIAFVTSVISPNQRFQALFYKSRRFVLSSILQ